MNLENYSTWELERELRRRKEIEEQDKEIRKKAERQHRIKWLMLHEGTRGNDLCHERDCRIDCTGCDSEYDEPYIPLYDDV